MVLTNYLWFNVTTYQINTRVECTQNRATHNCQVCSCSHLRNNATKKNKILRILKLPMKPLWLQRVSLACCSLRASTESTQMKVSCMQSASHCSCDQSTGASHEQHEHKLNDITTWTFYLSWFFFFFITIWYNSFFFVKTKYIYIYNFLVFIVVFFFFFTCRFQPLHCVSLSDWAFNCPQSLLYHIIMKQCIICNKKQLDKFDQDCFTVTVYKHKETVSRRSDYTSEI